MLSFLAATLFVLAHSATIVSADDSIPTVWLGNNVGTDHADWLQPGFEVKDYGACLDKDYPGWGGFETNKHASDTPMQGCLYGYKSSLCGKTHDVAWPLNFSRDEVVSYSFMPGDNYLSFWITDKPCEGIDPGAGSTGSTAAGAGQGIHGPM